MIGRRGRVLSTNRERDRARRQKLGSQTQDDLKTRVVDLEALTTSLQAAVDALELRSDPLCKLLAANLNASGDQAFSAIAAARYFPRRIVAVGLSGTAATAIADIRTATGGGGTAIVTGQSFAALSSAVEILDLTLAGITDALLVSQLYFRVTTLEGAAGTVDLFLFGDVLD